MDWANARVIAQPKTWYNRKFIEAIEINRKEKTMNNNKGWEIPALWIDFFRNDPERKPPQRDTSAPHQHGHQDSDTSLKEMPHHRNKESDPSALHPQLRTHQQLLWTHHHQQHQQEAASAE